MARFDNNGPYLIVLAWFLWFTITVSVLNSYLGNLRVRKELLPSNLGRRLILIVFITFKTKEKSRLIVYNNTRGLEK